MRPPKPTGDGNHRAMRLSELQHQIGNGEYRIDAKAVADAILRRLVEEFNASFPRKKPSGK